MTAAVTRRYRFSASHRLYSEALSEAENARIFGKCNNPFGHGHNYEMEITVRGHIDEDTGLVVPIPRLDRYVTSRVLHDFDGKNMNCDVPDFAGFVPTTENVTKAVAGRLRSGWNNEFGEGGPKLTRVHLQETPRNSFELTIKELGERQTACAGLESAAIMEAVEK